METEVLPAADGGQSNPSGTLRRRLFGAVLGGGAVLAIGQRVAHAAAPPGETTTEPPKRPTGDDIQLLGFVQGAEMAAAALYAKTLGVTSFDETQRKALAVFAQSHKSYGQSLAGFLGRFAPNKVDQDVFGSFSDDFGSGDFDKIAAAASTLESTLVATHIDVIGMLGGTDAVNLLASIATVEGRHGPVLADLRKTTKLSELLVDDEAAALSPSGS